MNPMTQDANGVILGELIDVGGGLVVVVALIFVLSWLARKSGRLGTLSGGRVQVLENRSIGGRERLLVVEFDGREILVGVTNTTITKLLESGQRDGFAGHLDEARREHGEDGR